MKKLLWLISLCILFIPLKIILAAEVRNITFPVQGIFNYSDSYGDPRSGGRVHEGIDIMTAKMTPLLAAVDGIISYAPSEEPSWGYVIYLRDSDGYSYNYLHINNDTPGTDDGLGGVINAYAPGISRGVSVKAGQVIAYAGDSGNAEDVGSHLHFEIRLPNDDPINPYASLQASFISGTFNPQSARDSVATINIDKQLATSTEAKCVSNSLIKGKTAAVYYCGADGKRYVFPNLNTYSSWYSDFKNVIQISDEELAAIQLGGNVTYRPGVRLIKITTDPRVYAVDQGGALRYVTTPTVAESMYGVNWNKSVDDLSDAFFVNYKLGESIVAPLAKN